MPTLYVGRKCATAIQPKTYGCATPGGLRNFGLILEFLGACAGETFRIPDMKRMEFKVEPVRDGKLVPPRWPGGPAYKPGTLAAPAPGVKHACFFRVLPP